MQYIRNDSVNPYYNLALEEYVFKNFTDDDYILLWQNDRTIVVGKYQNTVEEINESEVEAQNVKVVRRNTGGGAVYHDMGNLNFSFISGWEREKDLDYDRFIGPVIDALKKYGVSAQKRGRNDIVADDKKISGNAQCISGNRILHHGTLLINSDMGMLQKVLNVDTDKIQSKGIKSVRSRVANIRDFMDKDLDMADLIQNLLNSFFSGGTVNRRDLTEGELNAIKDLADNKYSSWDWNYGRSPKFNYKNAKRFPGGKIEANLDIQDGLVQKCKLYGDFLALIDLDPIENAMIGKRYNKVEIKNALEAYDLPFYLGLSLEELLEVIF